MMRKKVYESRAANGQNKNSEKKENFIERDQKRKRNFGNKCLLSQSRKWWQK